MREAGVFEVVGEALGFRDGRDEVGAGGLGCWSSGGSGSGRGSWLKD